MKKLLKKGPAILLWIFFIVAVFMLLVTFTELNSLLVRPLVRDEAPQSADVIIILGGGIVADLKMIPWGVEERIRQGVDLYSQDYALNILVTGGQVGDKDYSESDFMAAFVEQLKVPKENIFSEDKSKSTYENAKFSQEILNNNNWQTAIVVTSDFHTKRACRTFEKQGYSLYCVASYQHSTFKGVPFRNLMDFTSIAREYLATVYYFIKGYI